MLLCRGLLENRTCSAVGIEHMMGQKMPWKQQRGYSTWVFYRLFRYLGLNYGRHRPPDSNRIMNVQTLASITQSRCKETILVQCDGLSLLWITLLSESIKATRSWNGNRC